MSEESIDQKEIAWHPTAAQYAAYEEREMVLAEHNTRRLKRRNDETLHSAYVLIATSKRLGDRGRDWQRAQQALACKEYAKRPQRPTQAGPAPQFTRGRGRS